MVSGEAGEPRDLLLGSPCGLRTVSIASRVVRNVPMVGFVMLVVSLVILLVGFVILLVGFNFFAVVFVTHNFPKLHILPGPNVGHDSAGGNN
jgi:hypothetical protein